jgi:hypothetical protein
MHQQEKYVTLLMVFNVHPFSTVLAAIAYVKI